MSYPYCVTWTKATVGPQTVANSWNVKLTVNLYDEFSVISEIICRTIYDIDLLKVSSWINDPFYFITFNSDARFKQSWNNSI